MSAPGTPLQEADGGEQEAQLRIQANVDQSASASVDLPQSSHGDSDAEEAAECQKRAQNAFAAEIAGLLLDNKLSPSEIADPIGPLLGPLRVRVRAAWYALQIHYGAHTSMVWEAMWAEAFAGKKGAQGRIEALQVQFDSRTTAPKQMIVDALWATVESFRSTVQGLDRSWKLVQQFFSKRKASLAWNALLCSVLLPGASNIFTDAKPVLAAGSENSLHPSVPSGSSHLGKPPPPKRLHDSGDEDESWGTWQAAPPEKRRALPQTLDLPELPSHAPPGLHHHHPDPHAVESSDDGHTARASVPIAPAASSSQPEKVKSKSMPRRPWVLMANDQAQA
eukprot:1766321-Amphidinium_carterae.1